ncbi:YacL family protein [Pasteurella atlantica]|uniref:YacL family protein n=3 Tax=Pasteurellaceae TaxID=712 RepID=A0ACC6HMR5_9PAST|nr:YacL family protein [Pasteurella atlantica]MBR0573196.1 YacL family protein [Pasteurella atlantica]MDP8033541.1 YacL family protein [Pasteurella atlantica]MDP8035476.1 YacL family protein [Pasteurella atlantica]MDP8037427.1 YacL family protein [Pasteurella atlantica]MDP8039188.1 YacL family protein [Pasteurella atlantica]
MDYQFTRMAYNIVAKCSMEYEAFASWLNNELEEAHLPIILDKITQCKATYPSPFEWHLIGKEYSLYINDDEVMAKANSLMLDNYSDDIEEDFQLYTQESIAVCGIDDFEKFILDYQSFLNTFH